jgi:hypothetical protein
LIFLILENLELLNKLQNNNFINFCLELVQNLDFLYFEKYNIICELVKENVEEEIKSTILYKKFKLIEIKHESKFKFQ